MQNPATTENEGGMTIEATEKEKKVLGLGPFLSKEIKNKKKVRGGSVKMVLPFVRVSL